MSFNLSKLVQFLAMVLLIPVFSAHAKVVEYELNVESKTVNFTGKPVEHALAINGSIPAPTLRFELGDEAVIKVINHTNEPTTLHWHGILVPWNMDGPAFSNNKLIQPGQSFTFRFPIKHTGTYWYHSHTELQEQRGLYGAIVIEDSPQKYEVDHDIVMVLSDWIDEHPQKVLANLKKEGDYYAFKKDFFPSLLGAIRHGQVWDYLRGEWTRMGPMDLSDVGYDAFLINGKISQDLSQIQPGDRVRFRIINAAASSYFYVNIGDLRDFHVISKDGMNVQPLKVNEIRMGIGETYDVLFDVPDGHMRPEFRATVQDITGFASVNLGSHGHIEKVPEKMKPSPYGMGDMNHGGSGHGGGGHGGGHDDHGDMDMEEPGDSMSGDMDVMDGIKTTNRLMYKMLKSEHPTNIDDNLIRAQVIDLELSGDMERYTWHINGKPFTEDKYIEIRENEVITFRMINKTMMHHPMHLHGHFFRLLNGQGDNAPLFHTVDVGPMKTVTIEFHANEPGIWFLHCHNLYHMKMGMARLVKYEGFERPDELKEDEKKYSKQFTKDSDFFPRVEASLFSNHAELEVGMNGGFWDVELNIETDEYNSSDIEADLVFKRYLSRFLAVMGGGEYEDGEMHAILGAAYTLPLNVQMETYVRSDGKVVLKLRKRIPLARRLDFEIEPEFGYKDIFEWELEAALMYKIKNNVSIGGFFKDTDNSGRTVGIGVRIRF